MAKLEIGKVYNVITKDNICMIYKIIEYIPDLYSYCRENNIAAFLEKEFHHTDGYKYIAFKNKYRNLYTNNGILLPYSLCTCDSPVGSGGVLNYRYEVELEIKEVIEGE